MNSSIRRALPSAVITRPSIRPVVFPWSSECLSRDFSQSSSRSTMSAAPRVMKPRIPAQMSMKTRMTDTMSGLTRDAVPDDIGLLPGTFIRPVWKNMPSIFSEPRARLHMEWMHLKVKAQDLFSVLIYCKYLNKRMPLRFLERKKKAIELHKEMYTQFAAGNTTLLNSLCCQGLYQTFASRISQRNPSSPPPIWKLHKYLRFPSLTLSAARVVSDRAATLPGPSGMGIRQVIVRIRSRQSLITPAGPVSQLGDKQVHELEAQQQEKQKDCTEYLVLQRFMWAGEDGDWKIWGLAEETTMEDLETDPIFSGGMSLKDKIDLYTNRS